MTNIDLLRLLGKCFIGLGALACGIYLLLALPAVTSFSGFLLTIADVVGRLSATVGLGAVLLALAEIAAALQSRNQNAETREEKVHESV